MRLNHSVPICAVSTALMTVLDDKQSIGINGTVTRAGEWPYHGWWKLTASVYLFIYIIQYVFLTVCVHSFHTAICSCPGSSGGLLNSTFTWESINLNSTLFCEAEKTPDIVSWSVQSLFVCFKDIKTLLDIL